MASKSHKKISEKAAYHEAGHAVAAFLLKRRFSYVTIERTERSLGHILLQRHGEKFKPDILEIPKIWEPLIKDIMISFAGNAADKIFSRRNNWRGSKGDLSDATDLACHLCGTAKETGAFLDWLLIRTENMLKHPNNWCRVKALAKELLEHRRIGYVKARKIMKDAFQEYKKRSRAPK